MLSALSKLLRSIPTLGVGLGLFAFGLASSPWAAAADSALVKTEQARVELLAHAPQGIAPGAPLLLGLQIQHQPHWHTYWKNPGDSGLPTTLAFTLPEGFVVSEIAWPTPKALPVGPLVNFGYEGTVVLPVSVTVPAGWKGETLDVKLRADWLICKDVCIPEGGDFALRIPAQSATAANGSAFAAAQAAAPVVLSQAQAQASLTPSALKVTVDGLPAGWRNKALAFLPELAGVIDNAAKPEAQWQGERWVATVALSPQRSESPASMPVVLVAAGESVGAQVQLKVQGSWPSLTAAATAQSSPSTSPEIAPALPSEAGVSLGFWAALALAFVGGMLLNLMPCVFPILSLKVLGFAQQGQDRRQQLVGGLAYTAGVVLSFLALAALLIALRSAGQQLGWGFQLQSPLFVAGLAALFTLIGLNLVGVFELGSVLPSSWAAARARHPALDSLLTGVLAVAVASPCTAPFMGASLGLAATLPAAQALTVFSALGLGMAAPYLAASAWPGLARVLPRPGAWMAHFKVIMAFPMFATVIWLLWVIGHQVGIDGVMALLAALLALAFATWAFGSSSLARPARLGLGALGLIGLAWTASWAAPLLAIPDQPVATSGLQRATGSTDAVWESWSAERVRSARDERRPVFVDFTAAWCVTCQYNKRTVLGRPEVLADFQAKNVLLLRADWTRRDDAITAELARLGRNGVPVYVLHDPTKPQPRLLSEILTVSEIRDALGALP